MNDVRHGSDPAEEIEIDLRQLLKIMRKWSKLIIILTLLITLASGLISFYVLKPVYQTTTLLMVTVASEKLEFNPEQMPQDPNTGVNRNIMPVLTMNTYLGQLKSEALMKRVINRLNLTDQTIASMSKMIDASLIKDSNLIEVKVHHNDPSMAFDIANAVSNEYLGLMREFMFSSVVVISPANLPVEPVKPNKTLNIAIAFVLGLMLSSLLVFLLEYLDNTLKTVGDVNRELGLPVLGLIPVQNRRNTRQGRYGGSQ